MDPAAAWDRFAGDPPLRVAQVLSQQSTAPPVVAEKQIKSMTTKRLFMVEPALTHPIANKWEPSVSPSRARLGFV
jgi:hypothetical protein